MARYIIQGIARDVAGNTIQGALVKAYVADTTTLATFYESVSGVVSSGVYSDAYGAWKLYFDSSDYAYSDLFDIVITKSGYNTQTIEDINPVSANTYAASAASSAALALTYRNAAEGFANDAQLDAASASGYASGALAYSDSAHNWAEEDEDVLVNEVGYSAYHWAKKAEDSATTAAAATVGMLRKNAIINGSMLISQRGTSWSSVADGTYTIDRWSFWNSYDGAATITQDTDVPASDVFSKSLKIDVTTADSSIAAGQYAFLRYAIEGYDTQQFVGKTAVLSFWVKSVKTGIYCVSFRNSADDRTYVAEYTINSASTWEFKTISITFNYTGGTWDFTTGSGLKISWALCTGSSLQTTANAWQTSNYHATSNQVNFFDSTDNNLWITGVQFEVGSSATRFEFRPYQAELDLCQRYFVKLATAADGGRYGGGVVGSSTVAVVDVALPTTMRTSPTLTRNSLQCSDGAVNADLTNLAVLSFTNNQLSLLCTVASGLTPGNGALIRENGTGGYLLLSADL